MSECLQVKSFGIQGGKNENGRRSHISKQQTTNNKSNYKKNNNNNDTCDDDGREDVHMLISLQ
jgi:hypothetical protein